MHQEIIFLGVASHLAEGLVAHDEVSISIIGDQSLFHAVDRRTLGHRAVRLTVFYRYNWLIEKTVQSVDLRRGATAHHLLSVANSPQSF